MDIVIIGIILVAVVFYRFKILNGKKYIGPSELQKALMDLRNAEQLQPGHAILELHKIFVHTLKKLSESNNNAAKVIEPFAKRFPNEKDVWYFHRLRNRAAHEHNFQATPMDRKKAAETYKRALESLVK